MKSLIRNILLFFGFRFSKNLNYDYLSRRLIKKHLENGKRAVDVGAHKGEILKQMILQSPKGYHLAFEPIPKYHIRLKAKFKKRVLVLPFALSDKSGSETFQWIKNAPAYSGFKKRTYAIKHPEVTVLEVKTRPLDTFLDANNPIGLIKIDVEGAEFLVLKGAQNILRQQRPYVLFEFGLGASDMYQSKPEDLFAFFEQLQYKLYTLSGALNDKKPLNKASFVQHYNTNTEYYFWAAPK